jgi:hypothetical protein
MRRMWSRRTVLGAALWVAAGCGSSRSQLQMQAILDACQQVHQALGQAEAACFGGAAADWQALWDQTAPCATYARHVGDGSVTYNAAAVPACTREIQASPCEALSTCEYRSVFIGHVADGKACSDSAVCGPQSGCPAYTCDRTCQGGGGAALGEACAETYCAQGLACDISRHVCAAPAAAGGPCGGASGLPCQPGLYCKVTDDPTGGEGGTCATQSSGACTTDDECASSQFCHAGSCTRRLAVGAPCGDAQTGCGGFSTCDTTSSSPTCVHAGLPGEPCAPFYGFPALCLNGSICGDKYTCVSPGQVGDACSGVSCASSLYCNGSCVACPAPDAGQP